MKINLVVNGRALEVDAHPLTPLLYVLREELGLTGTKEGCGEGECGACSVIVNGELVNSCLSPVMQASGAEIRTVEGLSENGELHPVQKAFAEFGGAQCGICTPGMVMASVDLLSRNPAPTMEEVREGLAGNLCRCTGYQRILDAVYAVGQSSK